MASWMVVCAPLAACGAPTAQGTPKPVDAAVAPITTGGDDAGVTDVADHGGDGDGDHGGGDGDHGGGDGDHGGGDGDHGGGDGDHGGGDGDHGGPVTRGDLVDTVETATSRADMSASLIKPADKAADKRDFATAIVYYEAIVVARGPASPEAKRLAELWTLAGKSENAAAVWQAYADAAPDAKTRAAARAEVLRLQKTPDPFGSRFTRPSLDKDAGRIFKLGREAFKKKQYGDALVYFQMGYKLSPELPGFLRELGATYEKLGAKDRKLDFYRAYLLQRPFGKNSDEVRKELSKEKGLLAKVTISSSLPCSEVWVNAQPVPGKLPKKDLLLAPGHYKALCFEPKYEFAMFDELDVAAGEKAELALRWAIAVNALENPMGRIQVENAYSPGVMMDLGISSTEVGVVVPTDGRALKVILKDDTGARTEERYIKFQPGQKTVLKW